MGNQQINNKSKSGNSFYALVQLMDKLRAECPWDKKQTLQSLKKYTIEEVYELVDAIEENNMQDIKEELGDVLFHTIFYAKIAEENQAFTITDVIEEVHDKLVRRHPHVFGNTTVADEDEVKRNWEKIKLNEGKQSILQGVPHSLPAIVKAYRLQEKVKQVGFDWETKDQVWEKVQEELQEFMHAKSAEEKELEFGDLLFSLVNYARFTGIDPESALHKTNQKFIHRFQQVEQLALQSNQELANLSIQELEAYWQQAKKQEQ